MSAKYFEIVDEKEAIMNVKILQFANNLLDKKKIFFEDQTIRRKKDEH